MKKEDKVFEGGTVLRYTGKDRITAIPEGVITVGDYAFAGAEVEIVICSSTLEDIGAFAFRDCLNLKAIHLNQKLKHIGQAPFANCPKLETIYYYGTKEEFAKILKGEPFGDAKIVFKKESDQK